MEIIKTQLQDLIVLNPKVIRDSRGYFFESFYQSKLPDQFKNINFIQDNQSFSLKKGTLRGIHFQNHPHAQTKLVRCIKGSILDVAVDLRVGSPTFLKVFTVELTEENNLQLLVPRGFGHAFITLEDNTVVTYKVDAYYARDYERTIRYDDPYLKIYWKGLSPILSEKDNSAPYLKDSDLNFKYPL